MLGISPIVMTLAMNGILQGAALIYCNGTPSSLVPPGLHWLMTGEWRASRRWSGSWSLLVIGATCS